MARTPRKLMALCRDTLRKWFRVDFDQLDEGWRVEILAAAERATDRRTRPRQKPRDAIEACYRSLVVERLDEPEEPQGPHRG